MLFLLKICLAVSVRLDVTTLNWKWIFIKFDICEFTENFQHIPVSLKVGLFETCAHILNVTHIPEDVSPH